MAATVNSSSSSLGLGGSTAMAEDMLPVLVSDASACRCLSSSSQINKANYTASRHSWLTVVDSISSQLYLLLSGCSVLVCEGPWDPIMGGSTIYLRCKTVEARLLSLTSYGDRCTIAV